MSLIEKEIFLECDRSTPILIVGSGFTGSRVAERLRRRGIAPIELHRSDVDFTHPGATEALRTIAPQGCLVLHSIPTLPDGADSGLLAGLAGLANRVVYLSTTGVYGAVAHVDATTPVVATHPRVGTEQAVAAGPWTSLILRPAAIYGPGRGVHVAMAEGRYTLLGDGSNYISRIHVDDLAALAEAALLSKITGAYPVADEHPCSSREIAEFCAQHFGLPMPKSGGRDDVPVSRRTNRRVDGRVICRLLGVTLRYPGYREGLAELSLDGIRS